VRADAQVLRGADHQIDLVEAVDDDDRRAPQTLGEQRRLDVGPVLVAVADDQRARRVEQGEGDQKLGLAARLETDVLGGPVLHDLLDDVSLLIDLDRIHAAEAAAVAVLGDGGAKRGAEAFHAAGEDVREADEKRSAQAALLEIVNEIEKVDAGAVIAARPNLHVPTVVDGEEAGPPRGDTVQFHRIAHGPCSHLTGLPPLR
jgi:hypothetical protein